LSEFCDGANKPPCPKSNGHTSIPAVAAPHSSVLHCLGGPLEASAQVSRKCQCVAGSGESQPSVSNPDQWINWLLVYTYKHLL
jgi:hypothetical protein